MKKSFDMREVEGDIEVDEFETDSLKMPFEFDDDFLMLEEDENGSSAEKQVSQDKKSFFSSLIFWRKR